MTCSQHSVHWGVNPPAPANPPPLFFSKPPSNLQTAQAPIFRQFPPIFCFFVKPSPPKNGIFQWAPIIFKCLSLTPSHLLKVTKFLVRFSQFKFLVMTKKNIFVYKLFLYLNISDFSLLFMWRMQTPRGKKSPFVSQQRPSKKWDPVKPHFWKFGRRLDPSQQRGGAGVHTILNYES